MQGSKIPAGIAAGMIGLLIIFPWVLLSEIATEIMINRLKLHAPSAHDLLLVLGRADHPWLRVAVVISAGVCAPMAEEFIFRAHLQTFLKYVFTKPAEPGLSKAF